MADSKLTALTETTTIDGTELVYVVEDPSGTPAERKATVSNLLATVAPKASPTFTGTVTIPDPTTATGAVSRQYLESVAFSQRYASGEYYTAVSDGSYSTGGAGNAQVARAIPLNVPRSVTFDRIAIEVTTTGTALIRLMIYGDDSGKPGSLVLDAGTVDCSSGTGLKEITISQALRGRYWLATKTQTSGTVPSIRQFTGQLIGLPVASTGTNRNSAWQATTATDTADATFGTVAVSTLGPKIMLRVA